MNLRTIPYGYRYENGVVTVESTESLIIQRIFSDYLSGQSLLNIAERLNTERIEYRPGIIGWNKSRIMRLIEDERYVGAKSYPALIDRETHSSVAEIKTQKNTQRNTNRQDSIYNLDVPMYCSECGGIMKRKHRTSGNDKWSCSNSECKVGYFIPDSTLLHELTAILNRIIENPENIHETTIEHESSVEVMKLKNEISRTLEGHGFDKTELRKKLIEYISRQYSEIDNNHYITIKLKADFEKSSPLSEFSTVLFRATVKNIYLNKDGSVGITLLNGQQIGKD